MDVSHMLSSTLGRVSRSHTVRTTAVLAIILAAVTVHPAAVTVHAGTYNRVLSIGDDAPAWDDLPGTDGKQHSTDDLKESAVLVVVFTCNSCPYAVDAEDRLIKLQADFADSGVSVVAINVNKVEEDLMPAMQQRAKEKKFNFDYLHDDTQKIARAYGAIYTPDFYVINKARKVVYIGAMDDSPDGRSVTKQYLRDAVKAALDDKPAPKAETSAIGCRVRYERVRRSRSIRKPTE